MQHCSEVVGHCGHVGMVWAIGFLADLQSSFEAFPGFLEVTLSLQHQSDVVDISSHVGMVWAVGFLVDLQRLLKNSFSSLIVR